MEKKSSLSMTDKVFFMEEAMKEAIKAERLNEVPIGAVIVKNGEIIGRGFNLRETTQDATMHAEIIAIKEACKKSESWRLEDTQLFVTLEPCPMCAGALMLSRVEEIYFGAFDPKGGASGSLMNISKDERLNHWSHVESGILEAECGQMLRDFFKKLRQEKKQAKEKNKKD